MHNRPASKLSTGPAAAPCRLERVGLVEQRFAVRVQQGTGAVQVG